MVCEIIHVILLYYQVTKSMRIVEVLDNDDSSTTYEIAIGTLKDSPKENKVMDVLIEGKTYVIPKKDILLEKYPLQSDVKCVIRNSKGKVKKFIVEKKNLNNFNIENSIVKVDVDEISNQNPDLETHL